MTTSNNDRSTLRSMILVFGTLAVQQELDAIQQEMETKQPTIVDIRWGQAPKFVDTYLSGKKRGQSFRVAELVKQGIKAGLKSGQRAQCSVRPGV